MQVGENLNFAFITAVTLIDRSSIQPIEQGRRLCEVEVLADCLERKYRGENSKIVGVVLIGAWSLHPKQLVRIKTF